MDGLVLWGGAMRAVTTKTDGAPSVFGHQRRDASAPIRTYFRWNSLLEKEYLKFIWSV